MAYLVAESPDTLQDLCLGYIAGNIISSSSDSGLVRHNSTGSSDSLILQRSLKSSHETFLHNSIADQLISRMSACRTLCDEIIDLFQSNRTCLRNVVVRRTPVTAAGLCVLRSHKLQSLVIEPQDSKQYTVTDIICVLNEWTVSNLRSLSLTGVNFGRGGGPPVIVSLCALRNLRSLDISRTDFNDNMLNIIVNDLPLLVNLDISSTLVRDVTSLSKCRTRLQQLLMHNVRLGDSSSTDVLRSMSALRVLDISSDLPSSSFTTLKMSSVTAESILLDGSEFNDLVSLDISGSQNLSLDLLRYWLLLLLTCKIDCFVLSSWHEAFNKPSAQPRDRVTFCDMCCSIGAHWTCTSVNVLFFPTAATWFLA